MQFWSQGASKEDSVENTAGGQTRKLRMEEKWLWSASAEVRAIFYVA